MKVLALDLGARRIGVALSDSGEILASPYGVIERDREVASDHRRIAALVAETGAGLVVVGLPLTLRGETGTAAEAAATESRVIASVLEAVDVAVVTFDERLTTVEAARRRRTRATEKARSRPKSRQSAGREGIDAEAAAILLEAFLASRRMPSC